MCRMQTTFDATYYPIVVISFTFFLWIFKYVSPSLSAKLIPTFKTLPEDKHLYWHSCMNSSLHAVITSCLCLYSMVSEEELRSNPVWHDSKMVKSTCAVVVGYMTADCVIMVLHRREIGDIYSFCHHLASVYAYYYVMSYGIFVYFANYRLLAELSTPWVNNRWFLSVSQCKNGRAYYYNGVILTFVFFACRILTMPYCWYKIYSISGSDAYLQAGDAVYVLIVPCFVLDILNLFWFFKVMKGAHKTMVCFDKNKNIEKVENNSKVE